MINYLFIIIYTLSTVESQGTPPRNSNYEYDEGFDFDNLVDKGSRLVGGFRTKHNEVPFIVAFADLEQKLDKRFCTGSLITSTWVITAAHCTQLVDPGYEEQCVKTTKSNGFFESQLVKTNNDSIIGERYSKIKCHYVNGKDLEITLVDPKGSVYIGVSDVNDKKTMKKENIINIQKMYRHKYAYKGKYNDAYGSYGGYDIALLKLSKPANKKYTPVCLATTTFDDLQQSMIAGFGNYYRTPCLTDEYGKYKYHYCERPSKENPCIVDKPPPVDEACDNFFKEKNVSVSIDFQEMAITAPGENITFCYRNQSLNPGSRGWCKVKDDFYVVGESRIVDNGWGFCSSDCFLGESEPESLLLRQKSNVSVLPDRICEIFLNQSIPQHVRHTPKILCVGNWENWKTDYWEKIDNKYTRLTQKDMEKYSNFGEQQELEGGYIASSGACAGDFGGPLYFKEKSAFVLTGIASGEKGKIGQCGGINNPTHYVRVQEFVNWIVSTLHKDAAKLCWHKKFSDLLKNQKG